MSPDGEAAFRPVVLDEFHYTERPDALGFADGERFDLGGGLRVEVVHLPGHTRGHCGFLVEPDGVFFVADVDLSSFGPYYGDHWSDLEDFEAGAGPLPRDRRPLVRDVPPQGRGRGPRRASSQQLDAFEAVITRRGAAPARLPGRAAAAARHRGAPPRLPAGRRGHVGRRCRDPHRAAPPAADAARRAGAGGRTGSLPGGLTRRGQAVAPPVPVSSASSRATDCSSMVTGTMGQSGRRARSSAVMPVQSQ